MYWKTLMLFLQMSNPRVKKLYCMCSRTMKLWSRWSLKAEVLQWDTFPEPTELLLIGYSIELIWTPKSKSNTSTPKTNSQTSWQRGISHVMSGIICWICVTSAISALQLAPLRWQNELNKNQEKSVSQPNRDLWWIWPRECLRSCRLQLHQTREDLVWISRSWKNLLQVTIDRWNLNNRHHQVTQKRITVNLGLLKSGKVELRRTDRSGKPEKASWDMMQQVALIVKNLFSYEMRIPWGTERWFMMDPGNLRNWITKKRQIPKLSSWAVTQQNLWTK